MKKTLKRTYFDMSRIIQELDEDNFEQNNAKLKIGLVISDIVNDMAKFISNSVTTEYKKTELDILFCKYIYPLYYDEGIGYIDGDYTSNDEWNICKEFIIKFIYLCNKTYDRYKPILDYYTNNKNNLLNKIENVSERQFDDTPQTSGGVYDDTYSSTYEKTKTQTDLTTLMSRLDEINEKFENIYRRWANEFKGVFIYV